VEGNPYVFVVGTSCKDKNLEKSVPELDRTKSAPRSKKIAGRSGKIGTETGTKIDKKHTIDRLIF
jgi:hypothetical protein